jgi:hypothetical protein
VNREIVDFGQHVVDGWDWLDTKFVHPIGGEDGVIAEEAHLKGLRPGGHRLADPPHADDPKRLAGKLRTHETFAVPAPFEETLAGGGNVP